jgi:hypothetical protein
LEASANVRFDPAKRMEMKNQLLQNNLMEIGRVQRY